MKSVAVLIPSYKPQAYIERCLDSLEKQTLSKEKYTVYIALNGPKDSYESYLTTLLQQYTFKHEYIYIKEAGVSNARNMLIEKSTEPFIAFIDDDDCISENYLEELLAISDKQTMAVSNVYSFKENPAEKLPNYLTQCFKLLNNPEHSKYKSRKYFSLVYAKMLHRDTIATTHFDTTLSVGEDSLFMAKLEPKIKVIERANATAIYYRSIREDSVTQRPVNKKKEIKRIIYLLKQYGKMLFKGEHNKLFVLTRIAATLIHSKKLLV